MTMKREMNDKMKALRSDIHRIDLVIVAHLDALNLDQSYGGNVLPVKQKPVDGQIHCEISKYCIKHNIRDILSIYGREYEIPDPTIEDSDITYYNPDLERYNIFNNAQLDMMGFLYNVKGESSIKRKSVMLINDAISIHHKIPHYSFHTNGGMVEHARQCGLDIDNSLFTKEEMEDYFYLRISLLTLDQELFLGRDKHFSKSVKTTGSTVKIQLMDNLWREFEFYAKHELQGQKEKVCGIYEVEGGLIVVTGKSQRYEVHYILSPEKKLERVLRILKLCYEGIPMFQNTSDNTIVPSFFAIFPITNSLASVSKRLRFSPDNNARTFQVIDLDNVIQFTTLSRKQNPQSEDNQPLYFLDVCTSDVSNHSDLPGSMSWDEFINNITETVSWEQFVQKVKKQYESA